MGSFFSLASNQIALKVGVTAKDVKNGIIWGNHSSTQYPDVNHAKVKIQGKYTGVYEAVKDDNWLKGDFITVSNGFRCLYFCFHFDNIWPRWPYLGDEYVTAYYFKEQQ